MSGARRRGRVSRAQLVPGAFAVALALTAGPATPRALEAQRAPVLSRVTVPHPYYWRNLYVPQVTTTPHAVAWLDIHRAATRQGAHRTRGDVE